ncbi:hypothetical protein ATANTOWER_006326 [Ataeniobius toweri]|uniref:Uncharacterized protein n=1 Tax=Ataeniobius toweri TaxID=208326 RepID=A0ABU7A0X4_9TELE|nr:hypothetical protein [Ataeniobius toweri]
MDRAGGFPFPPTPGPRHQHTLSLPPSQTSAPELHFAGTKIKQLNDLPSQVKTESLYPWWFKLQQFIGVSSPHPRLLC